MGGSNCLVGSNPTLSVPGSHRLAVCRFLATRAPRTGEGGIVVHLAASAAITRKQKPRAQPAVFVLSGTSGPLRQARLPPPVRSLPTKPVEAFVELEKLCNRIGIGIRNLDVGDLPVGKGSLDVYSTRSTRQRSSTARRKCVEQNGRIVSGNGADLSPHRRALVSSEAVERSGVQDESEIAADIGGAEVGHVALYQPQIRHASFFARLLEFLGAFRGPIAPGSPVGVGRCVYASAAQARTAAASSRIGLRAGARRAMR